MLSAASAASMPSANSPANARYNDNVASASARWTLFSARRGTVSRCSAIASSSRSSRNSSSAMTFIAPAADSSSPRLSKISTACSSRGRAPSRSEFIRAARPAWSSRRRARRLVLGEFGRMIEGPLRLLAEGERERPPAGLGQRLAGRRPDPRRHRRHPGSAAAASRKWAARISAISGAASPQLSCR